MPHLQNKEEGKSIFDQIVELQKEKCAKGHEYKEGDTTITMSCGFCGYVNSNYVL